MELIGENMQENNLKKEGCLLCGKPIKYKTKAEKQICAICKKEFLDNSCCEDGHYICNKCHNSGMPQAIAYLNASKEKDPMALFTEVIRMDGIHMHGPEHHTLVPCILLTAYHNCGGKVVWGDQELSFVDAMDETILRGTQVPGGFCGFWGACGAAVGAGIFASVVSGAEPLNKEEWATPQKLTAICLERLTEIGGPRCCKRTGKVAIEEAVKFAKEQFGIEMPIHYEPCEHYTLNKECLRTNCPYFAEV